MKIVKVIHGYPMRYNAGSEVYSQMLCQGLAHNNHEVHVFTREEDSFLADYHLRIETDPSDDRIKLYVINSPTDRHHYRYRHAGIDQKFAALLDKVQPDIVHVGHLNHLSTSLLEQAHKRKIPIVFTLHDYWLMCPRGQFMQRQGLQQDNLWPICDKQEDRKCAIACYSGCASGAKDEWEEDIDYWQKWIHRRMQHVREMTSLVDYFIAPANYLRERFINDFKLPANKVCYLDYGFDIKRFSKQRKRKNEPFTFGYIGTHIPAKGIQYLLAAFNLLKGNSLLRIWGRPNQNTSALKAIVNGFSPAVKDNIEWMGEYRNENILEDVFNSVDCIVVPSIWVENSPLVIHEALQMRLPVITADVGGMAEYVNHEINGLLFTHRNVESLAAQMQRLLDNPDLVQSLNSKGYLQSEDGNIPDMATHLIEIEKLYQNLVKDKR